MADDPGLRFREIQRKFGGFQPTKTQKKQFCDQPEVVLPPKTGVKNNDSTRQPSDGLHERTRGFHPSTWAYG